VGVVASLVIGAAIAGTGAWLYSGARTDTVGDLSFEQPLHIPPVLEPEIGGDGRKVFRLRLQEGTTELVPGRQTETWGANGSYLGPTLRASRGDEVAVHVDNDLPEPTTLHWHGMHLPAAADGNPHQPIEPGATWSPSWEIDQPAATLWYHPHPHGQTADHLYRGVAGLFLLDDESPPAGLPDEYGVDDIPVIIQDKRFHGDGSLDTGEPLLSNVGQLGDEILVNGTHDPHFEVTHENVRLRVLNASNGRVYNLGFADDRSFQVVGSDGGLLPQAHTTDRVQVSPGERVEIVARFTPGERTVLRSYAPDLGTDFFNGRFAGGDDRFDLLDLRAAAELIPSAPLPERLGSDELPDASEAVTTRSFELNGSSRINGRKMDMNRIDNVVAVDTTEIWEVTNRSGNPHNLHVHDVQFRVLEHDGASPPPHLSGPKDTVFLPPGTTARLALRFEDYTDPTVPYMFHCHLLAHEDAGMMAQFTVVDADEVDTAPRSVPAEGHLEH
jgi:FtsP/CotA-like multicopper oxidase with cupredoxin domain